MSKKTQAEHVKTTLKRIFTRGTATNTEAGTNSVEILRLEKEGLVRRAGTVQTGKRGRPAVKWACTDKARKRVKRLATA